MKSKFLTTFAVLGCLPLCQCVVEEPETTTGNNSLTPVERPSYGEPLTAQTGPGSVTIREGGRFVATIPTARPNVEETRWYAEQEQIVVKSRGNHGPATVQLFNSRTGQQLGSVMAYEAANGPAWAQSMAE
ncbi:hypothetical protein HAHE_25770 [Haloferula helveola]|uniref:Secreted protein n=1 Tax=Haloferula helveola TaxID=490095 RepID=A0ABN6H7W7_9BACT|nr:hypothetical protein HAHE_25770 [Haloferula helveola]